jgi:hypothetical protein
MSYSFIGQIAASGANTFTSGTLDTSGADFLVLCLTENTAGSATISDSKSNTWVKGPPTEQSVVNPACVIYYATASGKTGTGHTFTATGSNIFSVIHVMAFSGGAQSSAFDVENGTGGGSFTNTAAPGSITPTADNELVISAFAWNSATTITTVTGATAFYQTDYSGGANYGGGGAYVIQTTATAINMAWNWTGTTAGDIVTAAFKVSGGGGGGDLQTGMKPFVVGRRPAPWSPGIAR